MTADSKPIITYLRKLYPQADSDILQDFVDQHYKRELVPKKTVLFLEGDTNTRHYFVESGMLRLFIIDKSGKEFNLLFAREGQVLGDLATPKATLYNLETVEESVLYSISDKEMQLLNREVLGNTKDGGVDLMRRSYVFLQRRLVAILSKTAEDNYLYLRDSDPEMLQRLPQYHIASYLGVSAEFLSKIIARSVRK